MKKYFYTDGTNQFGPFTIEELKTKEIKSETNVWFQGIDEWIPAGKVEELHDLFETVPPPLKKEFTEILIKNNNTGITEKVTLSRWNEITKAYGKANFTILGYLDEFGNRIIDDSILTEKPKPPKSYLAESILVTLFCCLPFGIVGIVNAAKVETQYYAGDIEGANRASKEAGKWTTIGFWVGLGVGILYFIFLIIVGAARRF